MTIFFPQVSRAHSQAREDVVSARRPVFGWLPEVFPPVCRHVTRFTPPFRRYYYTGWQYRILPATSDVAKCPELQPVWDKYDEWTDSLNAPRANHAIVTHYKDGNHSIGWHSDKIHSIVCF